MNSNDFIKNILGDIRVELTEEFDRNFERKSFFGQTWKTPGLQNRRGSVLMRSGALRRSIKSREQNNQVSWSSSLPYASIHNNGGEIVVTDKMKRFFWAMYYKSSGAISKNKDGSNSKSQRNQRLSAEAQQWKNLALMKTGQTMKIEQRQFIGDHPKVREKITSVVDANFQELKKEMINQMRKK
ncbi:phage virion morphogenesis protein [Flavobacterium suncheonense]|uniref:Phage morphogenesis protein n=1 Tax=Flavobacterium suncheonense GH29-5 = DSM 17707 TaxID=1121899 RepID=A0A0A2ME95_9FLAO|nr:phage virion morphogenesis protein [Flavobacterium suncheonense]KGO89748.1 hypothetical protein Q764_06045 [Flavobacterium suncheonense GH29-5 = DSM 17707]